MVQEGKGGESDQELLKGMERGSLSSLRDMPSGRPARCVNILSPQADIIFKLFGYKTDQEIGIEIGERLEKEIEEKGILSLSENEPAIRSEVVNKVIAERTKKRDALSRNSKGVVKDLQSFLDRFSTCIRCHNCMVACPICYCKECVFRTAVFEHEGDQFLKMGGSKGGDSDAHRYPHLPSHPDVPHGDFLYWMRTL